MYSSSWEIKQPSWSSFTTLLPRAPSLIGNGVEALAWTFSNKLTETRSFSQPNCREGSDRDANVASQAKKGNTFIRMKASSAEKLRPVVVFTLLFIFLYFFFLPQPVIQNYHHPVDAS